MKKLLNILSTISIIGAASATVVACGSNTDLALNTTVDDSIQLFAITNLKTSTLVRNNVKLGGNVSKEKIDELIKLLNLENKIENSELGPQLWLSFRVCLMANQLLGNISTSVPNYGWINSKVQWQSSRWGFNQLLNLSSEQGIGMNMSGWLANDSEYSLSVTFLQEDLTGWKGLNDPAFARININKRIVVDKSGIVDVENSNQYGIWLDENTDPNNVSAIDIVESTDVSQTKNRGNVYQGFVNSSSLIDLSDIYDPNDDSVPSSVFTFTPSVMDLVNNIFVESSIINTILANSKDEIEDTVSEYLVNNPIFLGEKVTLEHVERRIRNQIYIVMFKNVMHRRDEANNFPAQDLAYADAIISIWWRQLRVSLNTVLGYDWLTTEDTARLTALKDNLDDYIKRDRSGELTDAEIDSITSDLQFMVGVSKQPGAYDATEIAISNSAFKTSFKYATTQLSAQGAGEPVVINSMTGLTNFGANNSRELIVTYYYEKNDLPDTVLQNLVYRPDEGKDPLTTNFVTDMGFKNIFASSRIEKLLPYFTASMLSSYKGGYYESKQAQNGSFMLGDVFDLSKAEGITDFNQGTSATDTTDWFTQAGFTDQFKVTSKNDLSIAMLSQLFSQNLTNNIRNVFDVNNQATTTYGNIWDYGVSFDNLVDDTLLTAGIITAVTDDDDQAFSNLIVDPNYMKISDLSLDGTSDFRTNIWNFGLDSSPTDVYAIFNNTDSYGVLNPSAGDPNTWWQDSSKYRYQFSALLDLYSTQNPDLFDEFVSYWDKWVRNNKDNLDSKF